MARKSKPIETREDLHAFLKAQAKSDLRACAKNALRNVSGKPGIGRINLEHYDSVFTLRTNAYVAVDAHGRNALLPGRVLASGTLAEVAEVLARSYAVEGVPADWLDW